MKRKITPTEYNVALPSSRTKAISYPFLYPFPTAFQLGCVIIASTPNR